MRVTRGVGSVCTLQLHHVISSRSMRLRRNFGLEVRCVASSQYQGAPEALKTSEQPCNVEGLEDNDSPVLTNLLSTTPDGLLLLLLPSPQPQRPDHYCDDAYFDFYCNSLLPLRIYFHHIAAPVRRRDRRQTSRLLLPISGLHRAGGITGRSG